jgi:response regulator RpfG family c-di-GMP phosphodiesterase
MNSPHIYSYNARGEALVPIPSSDIDNAIVETQLRSRILIVNDEPAICALLTGYLKELGYASTAVGDSREALRQTQNNLLDLIITDISMPGMDGMNLLREIKRRDDSFPVVMITGNNDPLRAIDAMKTGADDYILKPFDLRDVSRAIDGSLKRRILRKKIQAFQNELERMLAEHTSQVQRLFLSIAQSLIVALEQKDSYTNGHSQRVAWLSVNLADAAGMTRREMDLIHTAGVFHDLGKIGIPESILSKPYALTKAEYARIQTHCDIGVRILEPLQEFSEILPLVRHHHEHYDGHGYPMKLSRNQIPFGARVLSIADSFDAMISARPYRASLSISEALLRLRDAAGTQFDPSLVDLFIPFAESDKFRETIQSSFWTYPEKIESRESIALPKYPLDIFNGLAHIAIPQSVSPQYPA